MKCLKWVTSATPIALLPSPLPSSLNSPVWDICAPAPPCVIIFIFFFQLPSQRGSILHFKHTHTHALTATCAHSKLHQMRKPKCLYYNQHAVYKGKRVHRSVPTTHTKLPLQNSLQFRKVIKKLLQLCSHPTPKEFCKKKQKKQPIISLKWQRYFIS